MNKDGVASIVKQCSIVILAFAQRLFGSCSFRQVVQDPAQPGDQAMHVARRADGVVGRERRSLINAQLNLAANDGWQSTGLGTADTLPMCDLIFQRRSFCFVDKQGE